MDRDLGFQTGMSKGKDVPEAKGYKNTSQLLLKMPLIYTESPHVLIQNMASGRSYRGAEFPC